ncbi:MarR family winged helix-turn-helix transcriptional regulator [Sandaracinus amylolyticus]|uniref:MarR family winged helix-turn-helix transcriptional regulator n=1 Tax=Sandaracinus amylolyticus TaxID=927083 RepID=UPI001F2A2F1D|nr:MarR family winged helix-turn-helix transcriptional regulator [Sandaracinus amylolyticus]
MSTSVPAGERDALRLRASLQRVVRLSGALEPDRTACGLDLSPSHAHALMLLASAPEGSLAPRDLASALGLDKSSATRLVQRMTDAGHFEAARDAENARFVRLALTAKGTRAARMVERASLERHARLVATIPRRERARVLGALELLVQAMAVVPPGGAE